MAKTFRVLIVEDHFLVATSFARLLETLGCDIVGPCLSLGHARAAARSHLVDAALLDVNLGSELVYPLAAELQGRGIPFAFLTAMDPSDIPVVFFSSPVLQKPCSDRQIEKWLLTCEGYRLR